VFSPEKLRANFRETREDPQLLRVSLHPPHLCSLPFSSFSPLPPIVPHYITFKGILSRKKYLSDSTGKAGAAGEQKTAFNHLSEKRWLVLSAADDWAALSLASLQGQNFYQLKCL